MAIDRRDSQPLFWEVLGARRMCRDFLGVQLPEEDVETILRAAFRGPSAGNTAGLDLMVLTGESLERYWSVTMPPERQANFRWPGLLRAPLLVIPYVNSSSYVERYGNDDKSSTGLGESPDSWPVPYWYIDGGAAVMGMLLAAEALGLGALFFGQFDHEEALRDAFGVPAECRAIGTLAIGYAAPGGRAPSVSAQGGRPRWSGFTHHSRW